MSGQISTQSESPRLWASSSCRVKINLTQLLSAQELSIWQVCPDLQMCRTFSKTGVCPYGVRCRFIHSHAVYNWNLGLPSSHLIDPYLTYNGVSSPESATTSSNGLGIYGNPNLMPENLYPGLTHQVVPTGYDAALSPYAQYLLATEGLATEGLALPNPAMELNVGIQANTAGLYNGPQAAYSPGLYNADLLAEVTTPLPFLDCAFVVYSAAVGVIKTCLTGLPNTKNLNANLGFWQFENVWYSGRWAHIWESHKYYRWIHCNHTKMDTP